MRMSLRMSQISHLPLVGRKLVQKQKKLFAVFKKIINGVDFNGKINIIY